MFRGKELFGSESERRKKRLRLKELTERLHRYKPYINDIACRDALGGRLLLSVDYEQDRINKMGVEEDSAHEDPATMPRTASQQLIDTLGEFLTLHQARYDRQNVKFHTDYFEMTMMHREEGDRLAALLNEAVQNGRLVMPEYLKSGRRK